jgi:hypothetical protein
VPLLMAIPNVSVPRMYTVSDMICARLWLLQASNCGQGETSAVGEPPGALSDSGKSEGEGEGLIALAAEVGGRLTLALHRG